MSDMSLNGILDSGAPSNNRTAIRSGNKRSNEEVDHLAPRKKQKGDMNYQQPDSPENASMRAILTQPGIRQHMPVKYHRSRLLNVQLTEHDPRNAM